MDRAISFLRKVTYYNDYIYNVYHIQEGIHQGCALSGMLLTNTKVY